MIRKCNLRIKQETNDRCALRYLCHVAGTSRERDIEREKEQEYSQLFLLYKFVIPMSNVVGGGVCSVSCLRQKGRET